MAKIIIPWTGRPDPQKDFDLWARNTHNVNHYRDHNGASEYLGECFGHPDHDPSLLLVHDETSKDHPVRVHCRAGCSYTYLVHLLMERESARLAAEVDGPVIAPPPKTVPPLLHTASWAETLQYSPLAQGAVHSGVPLPWLRDHPTLLLAEDPATGRLHYVFDGAEGPRPGPVMKWRTFGGAPGAAKEIGWVNAPTPAPIFWPPPAREMAEEFATAEGEGDAILAWYWGFETRTLTAGATTPLDERVAEELYRRGVRRWLIFSDDDAPGRACRDNIVQLCLDAGIIPVPVDLRLLCDPFLGGHKDLRDFRHMFADPEEAHAALRGVITRSEERIDALFPAFDAAPAPPEADDLMEDTILRGCVSLLVSKPGMGKTTVLLAYAAAARDGGTLLDKEVAPHRILLLTEEGMRSLERKKRIYGDMPHVILHSVDFGDWPSEDWNERVRIIEDVARRHSVDCIVIDTMWSFALCADEDKSTAVRPLFRKLRYLTRQGFAVVVTVHGRKSGGTGTDVIAGSVTIPGEVDVAIELAPAQDGDPTHRQIAWIKNRMNQDLVAAEPITITTDDEHIVIVEGVDGPQARAQRVLDLLGDRAWHTAAEIGAALSLPQDQLRAPLESLCRSHRIQKERVDGAEAGRRATYRYRREPDIDVSRIVLH